MKNTAAGNREYKINKTEDSTVVMSTICGFIYCHFAK